MAAIMNFITDSATNGDYNTAHNIVVWMYDCWIIKMVYCINWSLVCEVVFWILERFYCIFVLELFIKH